MKPLYLLLVVLLSASAAAGAQTPDAASVAEPVAQAEVPASPAGPFAATGIGFQDQLYRTRPVVVFADSASHPDFQRQVHLLERDLPALAERDVVVVLDSDPAAASEWRQRLRPRGFSLVVLDKDLRPVTRKPSPWDVREISAAIDKLPSRRQEVNERFPGR